MGRLPPFRDLAFYMKKWLVLQPPTPFRHLTLAPASLYTSFYPGFGTDFLLFQILYTLPLAAKIYVFFYQEKVLFYHKFSIFGLGRSGV